MKNITNRRFRILADHMDVYQFMLEIFEHDWRNGPAAPFLEYALSSTWMDLSYTYKNKIWYDGDKIVGFVFYESPVTDIYFNLRPEYEELASEMVAYADQCMPDFGENRRFVLFGGQTSLQKAAETAGYRKHGEDIEFDYDFSKPLEYPLPRGFRFLSPEEINIDKLSECCWKGFNREEKEGPYVSKAQPWNSDSRNDSLICNAPHSTPELDVVIAAENGEYACYSGMWWVPENRLAYMEPLCTVPKYRRLGLASAALSELYRRTKPLGATHMTGGFNPFYKKIGFKPTVKWTHWYKDRSETTAK